MRIHLYGYGSMGKLHAQKLRKHSVPFEIIDPAKGYPIQSTHCDGAIVATPSHTHRSIAEPLLQQNIPVLVEKPISHTPNDAEVLSGYPLLCVGHTERFSPVWEQCKKAKPRFVQSERLSPFSGRGTDINVLYDIMIHDLDLCLQFFKGVPTDIRAIGIRVCSDKYDIVNARIEFPSGVAQLSASRVSRTSKRTMRLFCTEDYWSCDFKAKSIHHMKWSHGDLTGKELSLPNYDPLEKEHEAFLDFIRAKTPFPCSAQDANAAVHLAAAIEKEL